MTSTIRIVIADDHHVVRDGLRALLQAVEGFALVGEAANGHEALELTRSLEPDILVLDLSLPGLHGLDVIEQLGAGGARTRVLVLSMHSSEIHVARALQAGAAGYLPKDAGADELIAGIRQVAAGATFLSRALGDRPVTEYLELDPGTDRQRSFGLTPREREVFQLAAEGRTMAEIAERLSISPRTVETHRENLMRKLRLRNQTELVRFALLMGNVVGDPRIHRS
jgi:DNA-binding NarL/FixJ family response regulator